MPDVFDATASQPRSLLSKRSQTRYPSTVVVRTSKTCADATQTSIVLCPSLLVRISIHNSHGPIYVAYKLYRQTVRTSVHACTNMRDELAGTCMRACTWYHICTRTLLVHLRIAYGPMRCRLALMPSCLRPGWGTRFWYHDTFCKSMKARHPGKC